MLKVATIVGTRPEIIKMCRVIAEFDKNTRHVLIHTGQNYDHSLSQIFFDDLEIRKPDHFLNAVGTNAAQTIARVIAAVDDVLAQEAPDAVLLYGDTNSCLSVIPAKRRKIPVFHMEAGNRCFDENVPEELNRKIVDHLSDINIVLTEHARRHLLAEGLRAERIIKSGSHMKEVLEHFRPKIEASGILGKLGLSPKQYFLVSAHREENVDSEQNLTDLLESLRRLSSEYKFPIIVTTHPRTRKRLELHRQRSMDESVKFLTPFGFTDYAMLQLNALCVLSDSGTITEESSLLGFPAITIRNTHERPEGMDHGTLIMSGLKADRILDAVRVVVNSNEAGVRFPLVPDYNSDYVSKKILRIVLSYTDYINRVVWNH